MKVQNIARKIYWRVKNIIKNQSKNKKENIIQFKTDIWQTDEISQSFIKGSNAQKVAGADMMDREVNEFFLAHCLPGDKVLDIGCGHGIVSEFLAQKGLEVTAVDISEKLLEEFRARIEGKKYLIKIKKGDAHNIPCQDEEFDKVVARMFLPHFPDWQNVLKEMARVTKRGGQLLVHFPSKENNVLGRKLMLKDCIFASSPDTADPWTFYAETDAEELVKIENKLGLIVIERIPVSFFLHNRIIGFQLGTSEHNKYMETIQGYFQNKEIREFAIWFDKEVVARFNPALSHFNVIIFKKI